MSQNQIIDLLSTSTPDNIDSLGFGGGLDLAQNFEIAGPRTVNATGAAGFDFEVTVVNEAGGDVTAQQIALVQSITETALSRWADFIEGAAGANISVQVVLEPPGEDEDDPAVASAVPETFFAVGMTSDGASLLEATTIIELRTGTDENGEDEFDILITVNSDLLASDDFFLDDTIEPGDVVPSDQFDLYSVLLHELGHGFGFAAFRDEFTEELPTVEFADGSMRMAGSLFDILTEMDENGEIVFVGENVVAAYGEAVILETNVGLGSDLSHFASTDGLDTIFSLLNPFVLRGDRVEIGALELAVLADLGLSVSVPDDLPLVNIIEAAGPAPTATFGGVSAATSEGFAIAVGLDDTPNFVFAASSFGLELSGGAGSTSGRFLFNGDETSDSAVIALTDLLTAGQLNNFVGTSQESIDVRFFNPAQANLQNGTNEFTTSVSFQLIGDSASSSDLQGSGGADVILGRDGNDDISGGSGADILDGGAGNDILRDGGGNDSASGGAGNDTFVVGVGINAFDGGSGSDTIDYSIFATGISVDLVNQTLSGGAAGNDTIASIENVAGTNGSDTLIGNGEDNILNGGSGNDTVSGGAGNDTFVIGTGINSTNGGAGSDTVDYSQFFGGITFNLANQTLSGGAAVNDTISSIENAIGTNGNDTFFDGASTNTLDGGAGNDTFIANTGVNLFIGGSGSDTIDYSLFQTGITFDLAAQDLSGGAAVNDDISGIENAIGTNGNDTFVSSAADNVFTGGTGADTFEFNTANSGDDTITDFSSAQGDTIALEGVASFDDLGITQSGSDAVIDFEGGNTLTLEGVNAADLTASDFDFGDSGSAIRQPDGDVTVERSITSGPSVDTSEVGDLFVFATNVASQPVSFERDSFDFDQETFAPAANLQQDAFDLLSLDLGIDLDATGQIVFSDDFLI
jgi:Ca2+-binding RTX toxin-like protein